MKSKNDKLENWKKKWFKLCNKEELTTNSNQINFISELLEDMAKEMIGEKKEIKKIAGTRANCYGYNTKRQELIQIARKYGVDIEEGK